MTPTAEDKRWEKMHTVLEKTGKWKYDGCDQWVELATGTRYSTIIAFKMMRDARECEARRGKWHRDHMTDWVVEVPNEATGTLVRGRVVRCHVTRRFRERFWNTKNRWLLIVNDHTYGFWNSLKEAQARFDKDCRPKNAKCPDCGHLIGSPQCCENDEELWK